MEEKGSAERCANQEFYQRSIAKPNVSSIHGSSNADDNSFNSIQTSAAADDIFVDAREQAPLFEGLPPGSSEPNVAMGGSWDVARGAFS